MENSDLFICVDHVGVAVPDMESALKFHTEVMGWRLLHRETNTEQGVEEAMLGTGQQLPESTQVQLLAPLSPESTVGKFIEGNKGRGGLHHVCYRVADIDAVCATLRERGVQLLYDQPRIGTAGSRIQFMHPKSTGGLLIELAQLGQHA